MRLQTALIIIALALLIGIPRQQGPNQPNIEVSPGDQLTEVTLAGKRFVCLVREGEIIPGRLRIKSGILIPFSKTIAQKIAKIRMTFQGKKMKEKINSLRAEKRALDKLCEEAVSTPTDPTPTFTPDGGAPAQPTATRSSADPTPTDTPAPPTPTPTSTPFLVNGDQLTAHLARPISEPSNPAFTGMIINGDDAPVQFSFNAIAGEVDRYVAVVTDGELLELTNSKNTNGKIQTTRTFRQFVNIRSVCFYGYVLKGDNTRSKFKHHASIGSAPGSCSLGE